MSARITKAGHEQAAPPALEGLADDVIGDIATFLSLVPALRFSLPLSASRCDKGQVPWQTTTQVCPFWAKTTPTTTPSVQVAPEASAGPRGRWRTWQSRKTRYLAHFAPKRTAVLHCLKAKRMLLSLLLVRLTVRLGCAAADCSYHQKSVVLICGSYRWMPGVWCGPSLPCCCPSRRSWEADAGVSRCPAVLAASFTAVLLSAVADAHVLHGASWQHFCVPDFQACTPLRAHECA